MSTSVSNLPASGSAASGGISTDRLPPGSDSTDTAEEAVKVTIIQPSKGWIAIDWKELAHSRELLLFLVWRDIKVRYKQATLGVLWAVLVPLIQVAIFSLIFGSGLKLSVGPGGPSKPYPLYIFSAMLVWQMISRSVSDGGLSLVTQQHLLTKIYFPRLFVPTAAVGGAVFDLLISLPIFIASLIFFQTAPSWTVIFFPLLVVQAALLGAGCAYILSALTVTHRDFRFVIPFITQIWMWLSFVMIPVPQSWLTSSKWKYLFYCNPVYGVVSTARRMLIDMDDAWSPWYLVSSIGITLVLLVIGLFYFRRTERRFADIA